MALPLPAGVKPPVTRCGHILTPRRGSCLTAIVIAIVLIINVFLGPQSAHININFTATSMARVARLTDNSTFSTVLSGLVSMEATAHRVDAPAECIPRTLPIDVIKAFGPGEQGILERMHRKTCKYPLEPKDVVALVFTSKPTSYRLPYVMNTWGRNISIELLGSVPIEGYDVYITGEPRDDSYKSVLGKVFRGLNQLSQGKHKDKKWFLIIDDDAYVHMGNYVHALSAFDPKEAWALGQVGLDLGPYRFFGGATIAVSKEAADQIAPKLMDAMPHYAAGQGVENFHDYALPNLMAMNGINGTEIKGMYSGAPAHYSCSQWGKKDTPEGPSTFPISFHFMNGPYLSHIFFIFEEMGLCADLSTEELRQSSRVSRMAVGVRPPRQPSGPTLDQVKQTWGKYVGMVISTNTSREEAFSFLTSQETSADWYMVLGADFYVIPENLEKVLSRYKAEEPLMIVSPGERDDEDQPMIVSQGLLASMNPDLKDLHQAAGINVVEASELVASSKVTSGPKTNQSPSSYACAATIHLHDQEEHMRKEQWEREVKNQFYLVDYAVHTWFRTPFQSKRNGAIVLAALGGIFAFTFVEPMFRSEAPAGDGGHALFVGSTGGAIKSWRHVRSNQTHEELLRDLDDPFKMMEWMGRLLDGCGDICRYDIPGTPSLDFDFVEKKVNCPALMSNDAIDESRPQGLPAPKEIPPAMMDAFLYGGQVKLDHYHLDQRYSGTSGFDPVWTEAEVNEQKQKCIDGTLIGSYDAGVTAAIFSTMKRADLRGLKVLVLGSERPWVEACALAAGAKDVLTVEYGAIKSEHPQVSALTPHQLREHYKDYMEYFDVVVAHSSVEHSGLGRYGDALNPWGDRQAIARAWCMTKPGGKLIIGTPIPGVFKVDHVNMNVHRLYGAIMHPHLLANWKQLWSSEPIQDDKSHRVYLLQK